MSKAIRRVESRLGVILLERSSRHVALTPAGQALVDHVRHALNAVRAAADKARRAGDPQAHLRLVIKPGATPAGRGSAGPGHPRGTKAPRSPTLPKPPKPPPLKPPPPK
ncbi:LysR family transcriptional regulator [Winogradskya humida]|uniref:LysR family transcriptional regulator n=1 Tax=Winogradskya humida TaxID=113566 RepID=UPI003F6924E7